MLTSCSASSTNAPTASELAIKEAEYAAAAAAAATDAGLLTETGSKEPVNASANVGGSDEIGSHKYCNDLGIVGQEVFSAREDGVPFENVFRIMTSGLSHNPQKKAAAESVAIAIFGDSSIVSRSQAYDIVYTACRSDRT